MRAMLAMTAMALCAVAFVVPVTARAQAAGGSCAYLAAYRPGSGPARIDDIGRVVSVRGNAFIASHTGWQPLLPGTGLPSGAYVRIGSQSSVVVSFGGHQITLAAGTVMSILSTSGGACVRVQQAASKEGLPKGQAAGGGFGASPVGVGVAALDASVTGVFTLGLVNPVSK